MPQIACGAAARTLDWSGRVWRPLLASAWVCWSCGWPAALARADEQPRELQAGAATSNITPPLGAPIVGGFAPYPATHIHDELHARCLVLDDGTTRLALVVCDLLGLHRQVSQAARALIAEATGIPRDCVLVSGTHTHSAASALGENGYDDAQPLDEYQQFVVRRIADGVRRALHTLRPAELAWCSADVPEHLFNRRWRLRAGAMPPNPFGQFDEVKMNPPAGSPDLLEPAGPIDPTVSILSVREPGGRPISVFAAYSLHYVGGVEGGDVSADYFAVFCDELARLQQADAQDPPFVALLANGTSGDINNINFLNPRPAQPPYAQMQSVGRDLAARVHAALDGATYRRDIRLDARYREPTIAWRRPTEEELTWARQTLAAPAPPEGTVDLPRIYAERALRLAANPPTADVPVQVLAIGEGCLGSLPCEVFCEIGLEFRARCPLQPAALVSLNHGYYGYLPTPQQHRLGGYETWIGTNRLEREASVKLLDALLEMAEEMRAARTAQ